MDLSAEAWWLMAAGILVVAELTTGTFYLLMLALGLLAASVVSYLGASLSWQIVSAALVSTLATALWHWSRFRHPRSMPVSKNKDVHLDIGEAVQVPSWSPEGTAEVFYRGTHWRARRQTGAPEALGLHCIVAVEGSTLTLLPLKDATYTPLN